ncbi:MAG: hypothetical protein AUF73_01750 [Thaumarchaeota archaeon 13_1_20CM_2_39_11]|nr:MAG: hypothetical protein AUI59_01555 [Thaumarchaeota archaeon 13_1_40CM_2_39_13_1]OLE44070.1 MAG: hypothetical protein AUF73_01750 [Thaumarchaeota archaeon 13_1_20CM_2_39_11]
MDYPVEVQADGIKLQPEKMEIDKLYYCLYQDKIMLFYKDHSEMLNCYEISEKDIVDQVKQSKTEDIENILQKFIDEKNLNH